GGLCQRAELPRGSRMLRWGLLRGREPLRKLCLRAVLSQREETVVNDRFDFDQLARDLAAGLSRREALRRLGGGLVATLLAGLSLDQAWGQSTGACAQFCTSIFPPGQARGRCTSDAAHQTGLCSVCGPAAPSGHPDVCGLFGGSRYCCTAAVPDC